MNQNAFFNIILTGAVSLFVLAMSGIALLYTYASLSYESPYVSDGTCSIAQIKLRGVISTLHNHEDMVDNEYIANTDYIVSSLKAADQDDSIHGVVLEIDSYGGGPVASLLVAEQLMRMQKPTVALIREAGISGGYIAALGAQHIIASPLSSIGSIAITASYTDTTEKNKKEGIRFVELATGKYKDTGNPNRPLSDSEREKMIAELRDNHEYLVDFLAKRRSLSFERSAALADGSKYSATQALKEKLIDHIGSIDDAQALLSEQAHTQLSLCE